MLDRAVLCVIFKPKIMSSLIKSSDVIHALYHWGLELRTFPIFVKTLKMANVQCKIEVERRTQDLFQYKAHYV